MVASNFKLYLMTSKTRAIFFTQQINYWSLSEVSKNVLRETYSTVTLLAKFLGLSTSVPLAQAV
jgi:hypothetical protein